MRRATFAFVGMLAVTVVFFAVVADHALVNEASRAAEAERAEAARTAALTAEAVRAALARVEQAVQDGSPGPGTTVARAVDAGYHSNPDLSTVPYGRRSVDELRELLSSTRLTSNGLPEAVAAAVALGGPEDRAVVADRLLAGILPVSPDDLPHLAEALGAGTDRRIEPLVASLRRAQSAGDPPLSPRFRRTFTGRGSIEGVSRNGRIAERYEVDVGELLRAAGVEGLATVASGSAGRRSDARTTLVAVSGVENLTLAVSRGVSGQLRVRSLRIVLWAALAISVLGLGAVLRGIHRETQALARERAFVGSVTHELRTPLAAIRLLGERLAGGRGDSREYGALVAAESERLETLVEHVLVATRADEKPALTRLNPVDVVESAVRLITPWAEKRDVRISIDDSLRGGPLPGVCWDRDAVRRALLNLLDNAIKHGRRGGLVTLSGAVSTDTIRLSVTDDGPGIARRDRRRVFGRFERGSTAGPGTGLGLHVSERIARAHGGCIELHTREGRGATFTLVLPVAPPGAAMVHPESVTA